jgi:predicted transcriptional regulator
VQYDTALTLAPGKYHLKVVVRENRTGRMGSFETDFAIPDLKSVPLKMSSIVLASQVQQQLVKGLLTGHKVSEVMERDLEPVSAEMTIQDLVDNRVLAHGQRCFVAQRVDGTAGLLTLTDIKRIPRAAWPGTRVAQVMIPQENLISIEADSEVWNALEKMGRDGVNQLPVFQDGRIVGLLSRDDLLHFLRVLQVMAS